MASSSFKMLPFTILVDTREQAPFQFMGYKDKGIDLVATVQMQGLKVGDYSIAGYENFIAIERKSLPDLFNCCGHDRDRFMDQILRLSAISFSALVIEGDEFDIRTYNGHGAHPSSVIGTLDMIETRYGVHVWTCRTRGHAEQKTLRIMRKYFAEMTAKSESAES